MFFEKGPVLGHELGKLYFEVATIFGFEGGVVVTEGNGFRFQLGSGSGGPTAIFGRLRHQAGGCEPGQERQSLSEKMR